MVDCNYFKKITALLIIFTFIFQSEFFLYSQSKKEILYQFALAKKEYKNEFYKNSKIRLESIIEAMSAQGSELDIIWKCYALIGANCERIANKTKDKAKEKEIEDEAIENYKTAKMLWGGKKPIRTEDSSKVVEKIGKRPPNDIDEIIIKGLKLAQSYFRGKKKKIKWLLVAGASVVVGVILYFLLKKKSAYALTVNMGEGVTGNPTAGIHKYKKGETVTYNYTLKPGYSNLTVTLDGNQVAANGSITMDRNHTLNASSSANEPGFITNVDAVTVPEGGTAAFKVKLSEQPSSTVNVTVSRVSGDSDITVQSGSFLTFSTTNWETYQDVTLAASEDTDTQNGTATIRISAAGINNKNISAVELDNDNGDFLHFETNVEHITVPEGGTASFQVKLSKEPPSTVKTMVNRAMGDSDITVQSGSSLEFTTLNWDTYQPVTLFASNDPDTQNGSATIKIRAKGMPAKVIAAIEDDNTPSTGVINVISPNGGENWQIGTVKQITWNVSGITGKLRILLQRYDDYPAVKYTIKTNVNPASGSYTWIVGKIRDDDKEVIPSDKYKIRLVCTETGDISDGYFTIYTDE